jgi:hypothetical protein
MSYSIVQGLIINLELKPIDSVFDLVVIGTVYVSINSQGFGWATIQNPLGVPQFIIQ